MTEAMIVDEEVRERRIMMDDKHEPKPIEPVEACGPPRTLPVLLSEQLLQGQREVLIRHGDELYRLIRTRKGKLLLNKE